MPTTLDTEAFPRRLARVPFFEPVQVRKPVSMLAQGVDLGPGGIGLRTSQELPVKSQVELELFGGRAIFLGTVRWSQSVGSGFRVGIQFSEEDSTLIAQVHAMRSGQSSPPKT